LEIGKCCDTEDNAGKNAGRHLSKWQKAIGAKSIACDAFRSLRLPRFVSALGAEAVFTVTPVRLVFWKDFGVAVGLLSNRSPNTSGGWALSTHPTAETRMKHHPPVRIRAVLQLSYLSAIRRAESPN